MGAEIEILFDPPRAISGVLVEFGGQIDTANHIPLKVQLRGPSKEYREPLLAPELSLNAYRRALYGGDSKSIFEYSFPETDVDGVRISLDLKKSWASMPGVNVWGFAMLRGTQCGAA